MARGLTRGSSNKMRSQDKVMATLIAILLVAFLSLSMPLVFSIDVVSLDTKAIVNNSPPPQPPPSSAYSQSLSLFSKALHRVKGFFKGGSPPPAQPLSQRPPASPLLSPTPPPPPAPPLLPRMQPSPEDDDELPQDDDSSALSNCNSMP